MKKAILFIFLSIPSWAGVFSVVQSTAEIKPTSTTHAFAFVNNNAVGDLLVLGSISDGNANSPILTVTDSAGNTWAKAIAIRHNFSTKNTELWYSTQCVAGANTVTVTYTGAIDSAIALAEYANGSLVGSPFDVASSSKAVDGSATTTASSSNTLTSTKGYEIAVGVVGSFVAAQTFTAGSGYTIETSTRGVLAIALEDKNITSVGIQSATFTLGTADQWGCDIATFVTPMNSMGLLIQ